MRVIKGQENTLKSFNIQKKKEWREKTESSCKAKTKESLFILQYCGEHFAMFFANGRENTLKIVLYVIIS